MTDTKTSEMVEAQSIIERVARVIAQEEYGEMPAWWHDRNWDNWRPVARAVIEAMREPSEAMIQATVDIPLFSTEPEAFREYDRRVWQVMIEGALR